MAINTKLFSHKMQQLNKIRPIIGTIDIVIDCPLLYSPKYVQDEVINRFVQHIVGYRTSFYKKFNLVFELNDADTSSIYMHSTAARNFCKQIFQILPYIFFYLTDDSRKKFLAAISELKQIDQNDMDTTHLIVTDTAIKEQIVLSFLEHYKLMGMDIEEGKKEIKYLFGVQ